MGDRIDICRWVVDPESMRRGLGRRLLREVMGPHTRVRTGAANEPAIRLYESEGFRIVERFTIDTLTVDGYSKPTGALQRRGRCRGLRLAGSSALGGQSTRGARSPGDLPRDCRERPLRSRREGTAAPDPRSRCLKQLSVIASFSSH
ncbi:MAG: GNAT family N-acetyltransferase [Polyangiales bacterium]